MDANIQRLERSIDALYGVVEVLAKMQLAETADDNREELIDACFTAGMNPFD